MLMMGIVGEILIKLILLKNNYVINKTDTIKRKNSEFETKFSPHTISFSEAIKLFKKYLNSKSNNYFNEIKAYKISLEMENYTYFGYRELNKENCLDILNKARNHYVHLAIPNNEKRGIVWYIYNVLIFLIKKEFVDTNEISTQYNYDLNYIGDNEVLGCFENINKSN